MIESELIIPKRVCLRSYVCPKRNAKKKAFRKWLNRENTVFVRAKLNKLTNNIIDKENYWSSTLLGYEANHRFIDSEDYYEFLNKKNDIEDKLRQLSGKILGCSCQHKYYCPIDTIIKLFVQKFMKNKLDNDDDEEEEDNKNDDDDDKEKNDDEQQMNDEQLNILHENLTSVWGMNQNQNQNQKQDHEQLTFSSNSSLFEDIPLLMTLHNQVYPIDDLIPYTDEVLELVRSHENVNVIDELSTIEDRNERHYSKFHLEQSEMGELSLQQIKHEFGVVIDYVENKNESPSPSFSSPIKKRKSERIKRRRKRNRVEGNIDTCIASTSNNNLVEDAVVVPADETGNPYCAIT